MINSSWYTFIKNECIISKKIPHIREALDQTQRKLGISVIIFQNKKIEVKISVVNFPPR